MFKCRFTYVSLVWFTLFDLPWITSFSFQKLFEIRIEFFWLFLVIFFSLSALSMVILNLFLISTLNCIISYFTFPYFFLSVFIESIIFDIIIFSKLFIWKKLPLQSYHRSFKVMNAIRMGIVHGMVGRVFFSLT